MAEAQTSTATHKQESKPAHGQSPRVITVFPQLTEEEKRRTREDITRQLLALTEGRR